MSNRRGQSMNISGLYDNYMEYMQIGMQDENANMFVINALRFVIEHVFARLSSSFAMTIAATSIETGDWFEHVIEYLVGTWSGSAVQLVRVKGDQALQVPTRKYLNLIMVDSYEGLLAANLAADSALYDDHEYYFIFLQVRDVLVPLLLQQILDYCLHNYWLHCNVMVQTSLVEVIVYTYFPYVAQQCQTARPVQINRFDGVRMQQQPMFPDKLANMQGCPLNVLTWHIPPFVELSWDVETQQMRASGLEMYLLQHLSKHMNFSLQLHNITLFHVKNYKIINGTMLGPIELLQMRQVNISLGYFRKTARRNRLLTSPLTYYYEPLVASVQHGAYRLGSLQLLSFPFQLHVWLMLLSALALHLCIYALRWPAGSLQVVEMLLGSSVARMPRRWLQRIIYSHWLYGSIPLRIVYQSVLFHIIRRQLFSQLPSSFEQLLANNYMGVCTSHTLFILQEMPQVAQNYKRFIGMDTSLDERVLQELQAPARQLFAVTAQNVANMHSAHGGYHILPQYVNVEQLGMYMPKHSYFYDSFNAALRNLGSGGFLSVWREWSFFERRLSQQHPRSLVYIGNSELWGIYVVMGFIYALALLLFGLELLLHGHH